MSAKRIDIEAIAPVIGTFYPPPFDQPCRARQRRKLGEAAGLTQFGVNLLRLPPGAWSRVTNSFTPENGPVGRSICWWGTTCITRR